MGRRLTVLALVVLVVGVWAQGASAAPANAKNSMVVHATCQGTPLTVVVNGNGEWTPAHVVGSTSVFIPTAFDLTFSFTPTGGAPESETDTSVKAHQPTNAVTCDIPAPENTFTSPDGTFTISGTVTGFFTPAA
jgi:hypothetical protein